MAHLLVVHQLCPFVSTTRWLLTFLPQELLTNLDLQKHPGWMYAYLTIELIQDPKMEHVVLEVSKT